MTKATVLITEKIYNTEFVNQKVTHSDGTEGIVKREKVGDSFIVGKEVNVIFGGKDLGYGYKTGSGLYIFRDVSDRSLGFCKRYATRFNLLKWNEILN